MGSYGRKYNREERARMIQAEGDGLDDQLRERIAALETDLAAARNQCQVAIEQHDSNVRRTEQLEADLAAARTSVTTLLDTLVDVLNQACQMNDGTIDSCALSVYADGLRLLAQHDRFTITSEYARRVVGQFK